MLLVVIPLVFLSLLWMLFHIPDGSLYALLFMPIIVIAVGLPGFLGMGLSVLPLDFSPSFQ
jgi:hypothetical protein